MHRYQHSHITSNSALSIFQKSEIEFGIEKKQWVTYRPTGTLTDDAPLEFTISGTGKQYIDLKNSYLYIKAKIVDKDGKDFEGDSITVTKDATGVVTSREFNTNHNVGPVNLLLHSLFNQVDLNLQEQTVDICNLYPYKSYLESLCYPYDTRLGESELFFKDNALYMDDYNFTGKNMGLKKRSARMADNGECDLQGNLHLDLWQQERYMLNEVDMGVKFWQSNNKFRLMGTVEGAKIQITEALLKICKVELDPSVFQHHEATLKNHLAMYPHSRTEMKYYNVQSGNSSVNIDDVFQNDVPQDLILGFVTTESFNGHMHKNPFYFHHCKVSQIGVTVDDIPILRKPYTPKFGAETSANTTPLFRAMFVDNAELDLSHDDYDVGYTIFKFKLRDTGTMYKGNCSIHIKFDTPLTEHMTLIVMGKFPNVMTINHNRDINPSE